MSWQLSLGVLQESQNIRLRFIFLILILFPIIITSMFQGNKLSYTLQQANDNNTEILKQFYSLHYPARKQTNPEYKKMRSNSVMAMSQHYNPGLETQKPLIRRKKSTAQKILQNQYMLPKQKSQKAKQPRQQPFSFKRMLSAKQERSFAMQYFTSCPPKYLGSLDQLSSRNTNIKNAVQKCKDEKMKISKVLISQKQSDDTKMDYLLLKRKDIEEEKNQQIKAIYQQFFRKEYEEFYGDEAFSQFQIRISETVGLFRSKIFSK